MALSGLDSALSGLRVAQQQMSVIASNVSNVSTPGYTRKILPQSAATAGGATIGVRGDAIVRNVDLNLTRDFWTQVSSTSFFEVQASFLDRIQKFHGPPDAEISIAAKVASLRDIFLALSNTPDDIFLIQDTVSKAVDLANKINEFSELITQLRNDAQDRIEESVNRVNDLLIQVADLNRQIKVNTSVGKTVAALEDARDEAIKEISQELEISFFVRGDGVMVVQTNNGAQLADESAETLFFDGTPLGPGSIYFGPGNANNSAAGLFVGGDPVTNPTAFDITNSAPNGNIGGLLELRDSILPEHMAQLDELAHKLATRFEAQGVRLFTDASGRVPSDSTANLIGTVDLNALGGGGSLATAAGAPYAPPNDVFTITLDPDGPTPQELTISLSAAEAAFPPASEQSLVDYINSLVSVLPTPFNSTLAFLGSNNGLQVSAPYDIRIDASGAGEMGSAGLTFLGLKPGTTTNDPKSSPLEPTPYTGFSAEIRVNNDILNDNTLIRESTLGLNVQDGSNEFIRRITDYVFGKTTYQMAAGQLQDDIAHPFGIAVSLDGPAADTLQEAFGFSSFARVVGAADLVSLAAGGPLSTAPNNPFLPASGPPLTDSFTVTFDPSGTSGGPQTITIDLSDAEANYPALSGDQALVSEMNAQIAALGAPWDTASASINSLGQLVIDAQFDINIDAAVAGGMGPEGLSYLGLGAGTTVAELPSFDVQVGQNDPVTITIASGDTEVELLAKLNAIAGVEATIGTGPNPPGISNLFIRPGPEFGGDLKLIAGPIRNASGNTILEGLFGVPDPIIDISHPDFHKENLGPGANLDSGIAGAGSLISFAQKIIGAQTAAANQNAARLEDEKTFREVLSRQLLDESGVNIDEELSNMIVIQTAFSASGRIIQAIDEMFQELLASVR